MSTGKSRGGKAGPARQGGTSGTAADDGDNHAGDGRDKNVRVYLRLRPMNKLEASRRSRDCIDVHEDGTKLTVDSPLEGEYDFTFDRVFDKDTSQSTVYEQVGMPMARNFVRGYNCCVFAYGQTGTGKTHSMMGVGGDDGKATPEAAETEGQQSNKEEKDDSDTPEDETGSGTAPPQANEKTEQEDHGPDEGSGVIPRIIHDVFELLKDTPPEMEYTIRCSYVEIYLEKIWDLLDPATSRALSIADQHGSVGCGDDDDIGKAVNIINASEACCIDEADVISLLVRGNACRSVSATKMNTDSSRSHAMFLMHMDHLNEITGETTRSTLSLLDLAGSEFGGKPQSRQTAQGQNLAEAKMIHRSLSALNQVVRILGSKGASRNSISHMPSDVLAGQHDLADIAPYQNAKLTRLLRPALGGNCLTSIIVTASSSSYNIHETLSTIRFGQRARRIVNRKAVVNRLKSSLHYKRLWKEEEEKRKEALFLLERVRTELRDKSTPQVPGEQSKSENWERFDDGREGWQQNGGKGASRFSHASALWDSIDQVLQEGQDGEQGKGAQRASSGKGTSKTAEDEIATLKRELEIVTEQRNQAENAFAEIQSDVSVLRSQNRQSEQEKKKQAENMIESSNETQLLAQKMSELEHKLRTSMFRESEATVFLRQFRRFYRRLLRHKAAQGTGEVPDIVSKVPGVPDLTDLIDVDTLLYDSGLIEETELYDDSSVLSFRPSQKAIHLSQKSAKKTSRARSGVSFDAESAAAPETPKEGLGQSTFQRMPPSGRSKRMLHSEDKKSVYTASEYGPSEFGESDLRTDSDGESSMTASSITHSIQPTNRMTSNAREQTLQKELNTVTEKCIELQIALNEEKAKVDVLTNRAGSLNRKRLAQEAVSLREALDKKTHDLQAIIWKMNELHLINKTYSEKMANRDQHVTYLEDTLRELQDYNRRLLTEKHNSEVKLRQKLDNLKVLVDAMTVPLWQFGECGVTGRNLANRIYLPVRSEAQRPQESTCTDTKRFHSDIPDVEVEGKSSVTAHSAGNDVDDLGGDSPDEFAGNMEPSMPSSASRGSEELNVCDSQGRPTRGIADTSVITDTSSRRPSRPEHVESVSSSSAAGRKSNDAGSSLSLTARGSACSPFPTAGRADSSGPALGTSGHVIRERESVPDSVNAADAKDAAPFILQRPSHEMGLFNVPENVNMYGEVGADEDRPLPSMTGMELAIPSDCHNEEVSVISSNFAEQNYAGGKPQAYIPRRFAPKKGLNIRAGVVKDTRRFYVGKKTPTSPHQK